MVALPILIMALGSNHNQQQHVKEAMAGLNRLFGGIRFTSQVWTEPIGIQSDKFLNCLAYVKTPYNINQIKKAIKHIETECGDSEALRKRHVINLDIDILLHGKTMFHKQDWNRDYIIKLLKEIEQ